MTTTEGHTHVWVFAYTCSDGWDGDETDIYRCECGIEGRYIPRYIPR